MKNLFRCLILAEIFIVYGCRNNQNSQQGNEKSRQEQKLNSEKNTNEKLTTIVSGSLEYTKKYKGKYPQDVKLFKTNPLKTRLIKLLGNKYKEFEDYIVVQDPLLIQEDVLFSSGCAAHLCGYDMAAICIYYKTDNILVGIFDSGKYFTEYSEKPVSKEKYPQAYKHWLDTIEEFKSGNN